MKIPPATRIFAFLTAASMLAGALGFAWLLISIKFEWPDPNPIWALIVPCVTCFLGSLATTIACFRAKARGKDEDLWFVVMAIPICLISGLFLTGFTYAALEIKDRPGTYGGRGAGSR
ncbi:MAG: hypothetical protein COA70_04230 [Planctomycetota bacterium]|nr:MAG: hypothetical protein COA70_04230 [Planctomycetota bacterium]